MRTAAKRRLRDRLTLVRGDWLEIERDAATIDDAELDGRVAVARLAILDVGDRLQQLGPIAAVELEEAAG